MVVYTYLTLRLSQWMNTVDNSIPWGDTVAGIAPPLTISPTVQLQKLYSIWEFKVITPGVSLGVLFPQGRHSTTYNKHMSMKELHTAMRPACLGKFPYSFHPKLKKTQEFWSKDMDLFSNMYNIYAQILLN